MLIRDLHHVNVHVDDLAAAEAFYVGLLGLEHLPRPRSNQGAWLSLGERELHLSVRKLPTQTGQHFAVLVDDVDEVAQMLTDADVAFTRPDDIPGVCRQVFTHDPAGNKLEFNQRL